MTEAGAVVHVVGPEHRPREFHRQVVLFIRDLARGEERDGVLAVSRLNALEPGHYRVQP
jgi:hypothetical protein